MRRPSGRLPSVEPRGTGRRSSVSVAKRLVVACVLFSAIGGCGGCGGSGGAGGTGGAGDADIGRGDTSASNRSEALVAAIAARLAADSDGDGDGDGDGDLDGDSDGDGDGGGQGGGAPAWPADLDFHPSARGESVEILALLDDDSGRAWSLSRRFDRVAVRRASDRRSPSGEDFAFSDVIRLGGTTRRVTPMGAGPTADADAGRTTQRSDRPAVMDVRREAVERATLGLASVEPRRVTVRDASLSLEPASESASESASRSASPCALEHVLREGNGLELRLRQTACPTGSAAGSLSLSSSPTLSVVGTMIDGDGQHPVEGQGWIRRAWGELPAPGGAVVFDRLLLSLDDVGLVEAERSKRRSGRGPRTTSGRLRAVGVERAIELDAIEWRDESVAGTARPSTGVPGEWRIVVPAAGIDVVLEPLFGADDDIEDAASASVTDDPRFENGPLGRRWIGAVRASGTHGGAGFVEFVPSGGSDE